MCVASISLGWSSNYELEVLVIYCEGGSSILTVSEFLEEFPWHESEVAKLLNQFTNTDISVQLGC